MRRSLALAVSRALHSTGAKTSSSGAVLKFKISG